jgi:hypothetical protein
MDSGSALSLLSSHFVFLLSCFGCLTYSCFCPVSGSNLASHMVGSLKKGSKQSMSLPSTAYNTLPAHVHHMRSATSSPRVITGSKTSQNKPHHKRSPSSDSGTGSNTPVSSYHSTGKVHHTVFLHGKCFVFLLLFQFTCLHVYMFTCLHVYMFTCLHVYMFTCLHVYMFTCLHVYMFTVTKESRIGF